MISRKRKAQNQVFSEEWAESVKIPKHFDKDLVDSVLKLAFL